MSIFIEENKKIKNIYINVNGSKKSVSSVWVNKDNVPTKVFPDKENDLYDTAPTGELLKWNYTLDEQNKIITLNYLYESNTELDIIVYPYYKINGVMYKAQFKNTSYNNPNNSSCESKYIFEKNTANSTTILRSKITSFTIKNGFDTSNLTSIHGMFAACRSLKNIDFGDFDTSNITDMSYLFNNCKALENINFNLSTSSVIYMRNMFSQCDVLSEVIFGDNFDTSNVTNMDAMFYLNPLLTSLDLSKFDTSNVTTMHYMFRDCIGLTYLDLTSFDTNNATDMSSMFYGSKNLKEILVSDKWKIKSNCKITSMFSGCGTSSVTYI